MYIIDRYEGEYVILEDEDKKIMRVRREELPPQAKEGDCIVNTGTRYELDEKATKDRRVRIQSLLDDLFEE